MSKVANPCLLIGDIGGTNARFALADPVSNSFLNEIILNCDDYDHAEDAIEDKCSEEEANGNAHHHPPANSAIQEKE